MNFKKIKKIENTYRYFKIKEQLIVSKQTGEAVFYDFKSLNFLNKIDFDRPFYDYFIYDNTSFFQDSSSGQIYKKKEDKFQIYKKDFLIKYNSFRIVNNKILIYKNELGLNIKEGVFSLKSEEVLWWSKINLPMRLYGDLLFGLNNKKVISFNIENGEIFWETKLPEKYKELQLNLFSIVYQNTLVLSLGYDKLMGINTDTGKLEWEINECNNTNYVLDESDGKLKGVTSIGYFEVDIATGKYKRTLFEPMEKLLNDPTIFDSQRDNFVQVNNHIITTDWRRGIIGAFNIETLQYDWLHEEKGVSFPGAYPIKYFEPYLFVMDSKETLHIFKKENKDLVNV